MAPVPAAVGTRDLALLRPDDLDLPIARHQFPLGVVAGTLALVLRAGTRLRRVAAVLAMHWRWCNLDMRIASYYSARLWCCGWVCTNSADGKSRPTIGYGS
jgi:hypothetical protein